jgi:hypothetical protein
MTPVTQEPALLDRKSAAPAMSPSLPMRFKGMLRAMESVCVYNGWDVNNLLFSQDQGFVIPDDVYADSWLLILLGTYPGAIAFTVI